MHPVPSLSTLANRSLTNDAAHMCLRMLDPEFNEIIRPESPNEQFSKQVLSRYYHLCKKIGLISDLQPPTWSAYHLHEHPHMRMAAIAEIINEIYLQVVEEKRALSYKVAQLQREISVFYKREVVIPPSALTISSDHLMSLEREISLLREEKLALTEENARLKRENLECKRLLAELDLDDPAELRKQLALLQAKNRELFDRFTGGEAVTTESPLRQLSTPKPPS